MFIIIPRAATNPAAAALGWPSQPGDSANSVIKVKPDRRKGDVVGLDIILFWGEDKGVLTGADVLGRLLRGIVQNIGTGR